MRCSGPVWRPNLAGVAWICAWLAGASLVDAASLRYVHKFQQLGYGQALAAEGRQNSSAEAGWAISFLVRPQRQDIGSDTKERSSINKEYEGRCYKTDHADGDDNAQAWCPDDCPFRVEDTQSSGFCNFQCVKAADCETMNPETPLADKKLGTCRRCTIEGCAECAHGDACSVCNPGYHLDSFGMCRTSFWEIWLGVFVVLGLVIVALIAWLLDLACRPVCNPGAVRRGLHYRSRAKLHMPVAVEESAHAEEGEEAHTRRFAFWPLSTNLCSTEVAGPGLIMHFNFQVMLIVWAVVLAASWVALAYAVDMDLLIYGRQAASTPRMHCILIQWGYAVQQRLMWAKHGFCWFAYVFTTLMAFFFAAYQRRVFQKLDTAPRMSHYAALCTGLPKQSGQQVLEAPLTEHLAKSLSLPVVGVSMCWQYEDKAKEITDALNVSSEHEREDWFQRNDAGEPAEVLTREESELHMAAKEYGPIRRFLHEQERKLLGYESDEPQPIKTLAALEEELVPTLRGMTSGGMAFVVFNTEKDRDEAVEQASKQGPSLQYLGCSINLEVVQAEPSTVIWENMARSSEGSKQKWAVMGGLEVVIALLIWVVCFYTPWAYYLLSSDYSTGAEPGPIRSFALAMVITAGNQVMYAICGDAADRMKMKYTDQHEAAYMIFYFCAIMLQSLLDFYVTYEMAYSMMVGSGVAKHDGTKLEDLDSFFDVFQTYAMQRELGNQLYLYFGGFVLPFVIEPLIIIFLPLLIGSFLVRAHPSIPSWDAENFLVGPPMDLTRYSDNLVNVAVVVLVFYFPGGYTLQLFMYLIALHVFILAYDHYRVLRSMQKCWYSAIDSDICIQYIFSAVCAIILSAAVFKCHSHGLQHLSGMMVFLRCTAAFICHVVVHCFVLCYVIPMWDVDIKRDELRTIPYKQTAERLPVSWFSANPVHCLRSQFIHKAKPHCVHCMPGKEHLLQCSADHHLHYKQERAEIEDYDLRAQLDHHLGHLKRMASLKKSELD
eukprot:TRINITY_DN8643_c0_g1_i1.p1 TRINITY_DN8643_c0_g1~~TRINITY_DN8643_c0_g1_i1.p1  ORF type:complete len:998 (+),score=150.42 TRINITY_DN8643_c0_g1_i1:77-3070(+)